MNLSSDIIVRDEFKVLLLKIKGPKCVDKTEESFLNFGLVLK